MGNLYRYFNIKTYKKTRKILYMIRDNFIANIKLKNEFVKQFVCIKTFILFNGDSHHFTEDQITINVGDIVDYRIISDGSRFNLTPKQTYTDLSEGFNKSDLIKKTYLFFRGYPTEIKNADKHFMNLIDYRDNKINELING